MNRMSNNNETFNCIPCKYNTTKKHMYEKHLNRETHLKNIANANSKVDTKVDTKDKVNANTNSIEEIKCECGKKYKYSKSLDNHKKTCSTLTEKKPFNKALYEKANSDFHKYMNDEDDDEMQSTPINKDNNSTTITTIVDDAGNTIIEKTTYSTTNSSTDYDVHIDAGDFVKMMNTSLATLKETGDKKSFVNNFFQYMFRHVTDIRHTSDN